LLNTIGIYAEEKRDLPRVVGVKKDLDLILTVDIVAIGVCGAHDVAMYLTSPDPEVDRVG
jgi:hypothetical protein